MAQNLNTFNANRLMALASTLGNVAVSIHEHKALSKQVAKVVISLSTDRCTSQEVASAVSRALGNGFAPVLGSFRPIPGARCIALAGFVARNSEVIMQDDDRYKRMRPVTANIMLDPQDSTMWDIRPGADGGAPYLVRAGEEDLSATLLTASVRDVNAPRMAELASCSTAGEFVSYVHPEKGELRHGFVLASDGETVKIVSDDNELPVDVSEDAIVEAALLHGQDREVASSVGIEVAGYDSKSPAAMTEYFKQLYAYAPGYIAEIQKQIDAHATV